MNDEQVLRWVANHMPVEVDGERYFLSIAGANSPDANEEYVWVFDQDPYDINIKCDSQMDSITIKTVRKKDVKILWK